MNGFADIYVIKKIRSKKFGIEFLNRFLPKRSESSDEYLFPQYSDETEIEFQNAELLMDYLEKHSNSGYCIYWKNLDEENKNRHGMIFYTSDSYMIFGISRNCLGINNTVNEENCLSEMKEFLKTNEGYITYECPPETTYSEFIFLVNQYERDKNSTTN